MGEILEETLVGGQHCSSVPSLSLPSLTIVHVVSYERDRTDSISELRDEIGSFAKGHRLRENLLFISESSS